MREIRFELDGDTSMPHIHEELEIVFVLSGRVAVMTNSHNFILESEGITIFNRFQHHEIYLPTGSHMLSCYIPSDMITQAELSHVWCCSTLQPEQSEYFNMLKGKLAVIFKEYQNGRDARALFLLGNLYELLDILKMHFEQNTVAADSTELQEILLYVGRHYSEKLTLHQVASRFFMSSSFFSRKFHKDMRMNFSEYLRRIRVQRASYLLEYTEHSVTDIALSSGFTNTNALIDNFKRVYGETPGEFRKTHANSLLQQSNLEKTQISYMALFRYMNQLGDSPYYKYSNVVTKSISIDAAETGIPFNLDHKNMISIGRARNLMLEMVRKTIEKAHSELGIQYIALHGILDDTLNVYHRRKDGEFALNFFYIDLIFDFLVSIHITPLVELSFTPEELINVKVKQIHIYSNSFLNLPDDSEGWSMLIQGIVQHFTERYGETEVSKWIFSCCPAFYAIYKVFTLEKYANHYENTFRAIRKVFPKAKVGGFILEIGFMLQQEEHSLEYLLDYCKKHDCMPDELTFQCFHCDYNTIDLKETEKRINVKSHAQTSEPAEISMDSDYLSHGITYIQTILEDAGCRNMPILVSSWNSSIWQCELGNDTCYKAAWIVKNVLENSGRLHFLSYSQLTDYSELVLINANTFHGGSGLVTYNGLPKAGYYAYKLLNQMEGKKLSSGDGYCVTRSDDGSQYQVMLYHYSHYNNETRLRNQPSKEEERTYDRYYSFCTEGKHVFYLSFENLEEGSYELSKRNLSRQHCSTYDNWMNMGAPHPLSDTQRDYLNRISIPSYQYSMVKVNDSGSLTIAESLDAHEVCLITIRKIS